MKLKVLLLFSFLFITASALPQGFTISGTQLIDANDNPFIIRGFAVPLAWFVTDVNNNIANIKKNTNANCLRIVVQTTTNDADWQNCVNLCIQNKIIPMVELHDVTCGTTSSGLQTMAAWWASKASFLTKPTIAKYILINIANEWGDWAMANSSPTTWRDAYNTAVATIRTAGINTTLVIDAPDCGQDIKTNVLKTYAKTVLNTDPKKNCIFSIHMYCEWSTTGGSKITTDLPALKTSGVPVMVGEFGDEENNGNGGTCDIDEASIIATCQSNGIGWLAWSWKGNDTAESFLDLSTTWDGTSLTSWGNTVVDGANGTKTATVASVFSDVTASLASETADFKIVPNPAEGNVIISSQMLTSGGTISIYNNLGVVVYSKEVSAASTDIDLSNLVAGVYFVKIEQGGRSAVKTIVRK